MSDSRTKNTRRNIVVSYGYMAFNYIFQFISRTIINYYLGDEYLGLSSLFTSILQVLSMAELGFSSAIVYNMYKPLADGDTEKVCALLNFYKKIYRRVGIIVLVSGGIIMPFVPLLIRGSWPADINIYLVYILYLLNTGISYFLFSYKTSLLEAMQRMDLTRIVYLFVVIVQNVLQIIALVVFKNYYLFTIALVLCTAIKNIFVAIVAKKKYPQYECKGYIDNHTRNDIISRVKGLLICSISSVTYSTFDSIIISTFIGLKTVAMYNNYILIFSAVSNLVATIRHAMQASVGNSVVKESVEKNYNDMLLWQFMFSFIASFCAVCLVCLYQPFMTIWMGKNMLLPFCDIVLLAVWLCIGVVQHSYFLYLTGNGMWWEMRWPYICSTVCNLLTNVILGKLFGTTGIIFASLFSSLVFCLVWQSNIIFKYYFKRSSAEFLGKQLKYFLLTIPVCMVSYLLCSFIYISGIPGLIVKALITGVTAFSLLVLAYSKTEMFKKFLSFTKKALFTKH